MDADPVTQLLGSATEMHLNICNDLLRRRQLTEQRLAAAIADLKQLHETLGNLTQVCERLKAAHADIDSCFKRADISQEEKIEEAWRIAGIAARVVL